MVYSDQNWYGPDLVQYLDRYGTSSIQCAQPANHDNIGMLQQEPYICQGYGIDLQDT